MNTLSSLIELHEDLRTKPYRCTEGKLTIGIGRNLDALGITRDEALYLFSNDLDRVKDEVAKAFPWAAAMAPARYAVIVDMTFNMGVARLKGFKKFLAAMAKADWRTAAFEMMNSRWASQVQTRAERLQGMVLSGTWPAK